MRAETITLFAMAVTSLALTGCMMPMEEGDDSEEAVAESQAAIVNGILVCDYNSTTGSIYNPSDPSGTSLYCANATGNGGGSDYPWSFYSSDGRLNAWWYNSAGAVNWGMCLNPAGGSVDYYLTVYTAPLGTPDPWNHGVGLTMPCKKPSWW